MSKINAKNLSYDNTLPPFLARLQASHGSSSDGRHEFHIARPKKPRTADEEAEDEPVYFDEGTGETLTKTEWEERESKADGEEGDDKAVKKDSEGGEGEEDGDAEGRKNTDKVKVASIGASRKRKLGKVVGGSEEEEDEGKPKGEDKPSSIKKSKAPKAAEEEDAGPKKPVSVKGKKTAKKGKKIKLSFGDEE